MPYNYKTELQRYRKYYQSIEPLLKRPSARAYTTVVFSFLAISLFGLYAILPTVQTILYLRREITDETNTNKEMDNKINALIDAQAYYQEIESLVPAVDQALPPDPDAVPIVVQLRNLASQSGVLISSIQLPSVPLLGKDTLNPSAHSSNGSSKQQMFNLTIAVKGTYPMIKAYLDGIINMRRIVAINGITITPIENALTSSQSAVPSSRLLQLALKLQTFYLIK